MENTTHKEVLSTGVSGINGNITLPISGTTASSYFNSFYSSPELIDTIVTDTTVELVYKRHSLITSGFTTSIPHIYKHVYSRTDGSVKVVDGTYIPAQKEFYSFD